MMRFESLREGFVVSLGDRPIIKHSVASPCLFAGSEAPLSCVEVANGRMGGRKGRWLRRRFLGQRALKQFRILESSPERIAVNFEGRIGMELVAEGELLRVFFRATDVPPTLRLCLVGVIDEAIYGGGAASGFPLDLQGRRVEFWGGGRIARAGNPGLFALPLQGRTWPQTAFLSSRNYWVGFDCEAWSKADFTTKGRLVFDFSSLPSSLSLASFSTAAGALGKLGRSQGASPIPPPWTRKGAIVSMRGGAEAIEQRLGAIKEAGTALCALRLVDRNLFELEGPNTRAWPSTDGIRSLGIARPSLERGTALWDEAWQFGHILGVGEASNSLPRSLIDLGSPAALDWSRLRLASIIKSARVEGIRLDFSPSIDGSFISALGGTRASLACLWPLLWSRLVAEASAVSAESNSPPLLSTSWGWGGSEGLVNGALPSLGSQPGQQSRRIAEILAHGLSGAGFAWMDASRYPEEDEPSQGPRRRHDNPALLASKAGVHRRAIEIAAFGPVLEIDGDDLLFSSEAGRALVARMSRVFRDLEPYHEAVAAEYRDAFLPPLRPATIHYEVEGALRTRSNQFMYGRDLLVATAGEGDTGESVGLYLPDDQWIHLWSSRRFGGGPVSVETQRGCPAVFWRAASPFSGLFDRIRKEARKK